MRENEGVFVMPAVRMPGTEIIEVPFITRAPDFLSN